MGRMVLLSCVSNHSRASASESEEMKHKMR